MRCATTNHETTMDLPCSRSLRALALVVVWSACSGRDASPERDAEEPGPIDAGADGPRDAQQPDDAAHAEDAADAAAPLDADADQPDADQPDAEQPDTGAPEAGVPPAFAPVPGLDEPARARRVGSAHYIAAQQLLALPDGRSWLYWRSYPDPTFVGGSAHVQLFDTDGTLLRESPLATLELNNLFLAHDGALHGWRNRCGAQQQDVCFHHEAPQGASAEQRWPMSPRTTTRYQLDWNGEIVDSVQAALTQRYLSSVAASTGRLYALTRDAAYQLHSLDETRNPTWSHELLPPVLPPELPPDAPLDQLFKASDLAHQGATDLVPFDDGVLLAVAVSRGTLAALNRGRGLTLPLPSDARCTDVLLIQVDSQGNNLRYQVAPTAPCERLLKLAVVGRRAYVASWVQRDKPPEPNDTYEYDIGLSVFPLDGGEAQSRLIDLREDDLPYGIARCGQRACVAGLTGSRSVNTGSTVTYGNGFVLPLSADGAPDAPRVTLTSARHSEIRLLTESNGVLLFFATTDGPITHTAEADRWLGYNRGWLGQLDLAAR